jgi:transposase
VRRQRPAAGGAARPGAGQRLADVPAPAGRAACAPPRTRASPHHPPDAVLGDKAYSSRGHRALLRRRGITAVIAEPQDQKANRTRRGAKGGRPPAFDTQRYKNRNVVERSFNTFKQWRALATRYDKLALTYRAGALLRAVLIWLDALGDTP